MINCPNCGHPVSQGQRFCGSCGTDVHAALGTSPHAAPIAEGQSSPYAYQQPTTYGGYEPPPSSETPATGRLIVIGGVLILAVCCAFACGLVFGFEIIPTMFGMGAAATPRPRLTPTPTGLLPIIYLLGFA